MVKQEWALRIAKHNKEKLAKCSEIVRNIKQVYILTEKELDLKLPDKIIGYDSKEQAIAIWREGRKYIYDESNLELANILPDYAQDIDRALDNILNGYIVKNGVA